ncbi:VOC family protein [Maliponia aquimaris]|uniref:Glyoxalase-like domain protein n=1 Tax=Maliponia aquimaris TaxID=1673631 RepID=A0A238K1D8_9RHOB|nr:VOC family protein [Maliponia aquimaris]SMX36695.1 Glyoxalase-like domain protein [Maliponia aquimaris]
MPHFEIHATDPARARRFYGGLFGWRFDPIPGAEQVDYQLVAGALLGDGLTGGMMKRMGPAPAPHGPVRGCTLSFEVADVDDRYRWALDNGGAEALPPTDYPGIGRAAYVEDGEGNIVGLITPEPRGE